MENVEQQDKAVDLRNIGLTGKEAVSRLIKIQFLMILQVHLKRAVSDLGHLL